MAPGTLAWDTLKVTACGRALWPPALPTIPIISSPWAPMTPTCPKRSYTAIPPAAKRGSLPPKPTRQRPARRPEANLAQLAPEEELIQKQVAEQHEEQHDEGFRDFHNGCHPYRILLSPLEQSDRISVRCRLKCCSNTLSMKFPTVKRRLPATPTRVVILRCSRRSI